MSENENASSSRSRRLLLVALLLAVLLVGGAAFVWTRGAAEESRATGAASTQEGLLASPPGTGLAIDPVPPVTIAAPPAPTAIATSLPTEMPLPSFTNAPDDAFVEAARALSVPLQVLDEQSTGLWRFEPNNYVHPIALEVADERIYLLDAGRILTIDAGSPRPPSLLLSPGDEVGGVRVIEPIDLAVTESDLFVLDRAGDVYRYELHSDNWELDRYDRPTEISSGHYFVALDASGDSTEAPLSTVRTLLETNYKFVMQYGPENDSLWNLSEGRSVDVTALDGDVYVLQQEMSGAAGFVLKFRDTRSVKEFSPAVNIDRPRQIVATGAGVYILDQEGRRLLLLDGDTGDLLQIFQLLQDELISAFALDDLGRLVLAGRDELYWVEQPHKLASIAGGPVLPSRQPHDPRVLQSLAYLSVPIGGTNITSRDFQMPGAPRHYRLGVHEGLDFYWQPGTKVIAAGDGTVVRADLDYVEPTAFDLAAWWNETQELGYTPAERLDDYLGRQVWIDHGEGVVSRYGHLRAIATGIAQGVSVSRGQIVGEVGNSGSPASLESERSDAHLHFELWLGNNHLGQYMRPIEIREWIESIFAE